MRRAFTLIEVNLAMLIMAGGILSIVGLYAFGFRENRQSREDVAATAFADSVISPLVSALSATNVTWSSFRQIKSKPSDQGWKDYFNSDGVVTKSTLSGRAQGVFDDIMGQIKFAPPGSYEGDTSLQLSSLGTGSGLTPGLVVLHDEGSALVRIAFRAVKEETPGQLLAMPLFYTEVRFQGVVDQ